MRIDRILPVRNKPGRVTVHFQDGSLLQLTEQEVLDFGLRPGDDPDGATLVRMKEAAGRSGARITAAELVGKRAMSRRELERKLRDKGASEAEARYAAEWLEAIGAIDDAAYAAALVRHHGAQGYGPGWIREKLREKGISRDLWEEALEQLPPHLLEVEGSFCKAYARICRELMDAITQRACSLPEHRVVPYPNVPKKDYPSNIPQEVNIK